MQRISPRNPRYVAALSVAAALILLVGWLARPRDIPQSPVPGPSESELAQLARRAERRSLENMAKYFASVTSDVAGALVRIPSPALSGLVWAPDTIVSASMPAFDDRATLTATGFSIGDVSLSTTGHSGLPAAALRLSGPAPGWTTVRRSMTMPQPGDWIVAIWRGGSGLVFQPASFHERGATQCGDLTAMEIVSSLPVTRAMAGGGVFNMDSELLGVILPCGDRIAVLDVATVDATLRLASTIEQQLARQFGARLEPVDDPERSDSGAAGLFVHEVRTGSPADAAGLWPGDVIAGIGDAPVGAADDLRPLVASPDTQVSLQIRRGARTLRLPVTMSVKRFEAPAGAPPGPEIVIEGSAGVYRIASVRPGGRADRSGLQAGDRVLRVDRSVPRSRQALQRQLAAPSATPLLVEIERDRRRLAVVVR